VLYYPSAKLELAHTASITFFSFSSCVCIFILLNEFPNVRCSALPGVRGAAASPRETRQGSGPRPRARTGEGLCSRAVPCIGNTHPIPHALHSSLTSTNFVLYNCHPFDVSLTYAYQLYYLFFFFLLSPYSNRFTCNRRVWGILRLSAVV